MKTLTILSKQHRASTKITVDANGITPAQRFYNALRRVCPDRWAGKCKCGLYTEGYEVYRDEDFFYFVRYADVDNPARSLLKVY